MHFQKNILVGVAAMVKLADEFVMCVSQKHNGLGYYLFSDNLSARATGLVKETFHKVNVLMCFFLRKKKNQRNRWEEESAGLFVAMLVAL